MARTRSSSTPGAVRVHRRRKVASTVNFRPVATSVRCALCHRQGRQRFFVLAAAAIAQLGKRQTEDLKVPGSIPGLGNTLPSGFSLRVCGAACSSGR